MFNQLIQSRFAAAVFCGVVSTASLAAAPAAMAEDGQMRIDVRDLDLHAQDGAQAALHRIERLSQTFCDGGRGRTSLERQAAIAKCQAAMTEKAIAQLNAPLVTALHQRDAAPGTQIATR